ncbi:MAG TPA: hypothetical protein VFQ45_17985 [Longimicrobium sp.]|nr:hypothetical protein [Longimicrobium sp.]
MPRRHRPSPAEAGGRGGARERSPRSAFGARDAREPRGAAPDYDGRFPLWAFRIVDLGGPWCWGNLGGAALVEVLQRLRDLETMTWHAIAATGSHAVGVGGLCKRARDRLAEIEQDDVDELFSLRVTGPRRVFGIRHGGVLRILWWDPRHEVYPSPRKHT